MDARMNKIKGIVIEQNKDHVIILTPDGQFIRGEAKGQEIGSESPVSPVRSRSRQQLLSARKPVAAAALLVASLLILLSALFLPFREPALAFIQLEVNPAVEFGIDSEGRVRELTPLNHDGSEMIREFGDWDGKDVTVLLFRIFSEYGETDRKLTVTSVKTADGKLSATVERTVHFIEETAGEEGMLLRLSEADREMRNRAMTEGVPISRLINQGNPSGEPSSDRQDQKKTNGTDNPAPSEHNESPSEDKRNQNADVRQGQDTLPKANGEETARPRSDPGEAPGIRKKETSPPASGTQGKAGQPAGDQNSEKGAKNGKPKEPASREKARQPKSPSEQGNNGIPPGNGGQDKKSPSQGNSGQNKQSGSPPRGKSGENSSGNRVSPSEKQVPPGQGQSSNKGPQNKNSGNGNGGNGNGRGN
jgi:hypothetical protein